MPVAVERQMPTIAVNAPVANAAALPIVTIATNGPPMRLAQTSLVKTPNGRSVTVGAGAVIARGVVSYGPGSTFPDGRRYGGIAAKADALVPRAISGTGNTTLGFQTYHVDKSQPAGTFFYGATFYDEFHAATALPFPSPASGPFVQLLAPSNKPGLQCFAIDEYFNDAGAKNPNAPDAGLSVEDVCRNDGKAAGRTAFVRSFSDPVWGPNGNRTFAATYVTASPGVPVGFGTGSSSGEYTAPSFFIAVEDTQIDLVDDPPTTVVEQIGIEENPNAGGAIDFLANASGAPIEEQIAPAALAALPQRDPFDERELATRAWSYFRFEAADAVGSGCPTFDRISTAQLIWFYENNATQSLVSDTLEPLNWTSASCAKRYRFSSNVNPAGPYTTYGWTVDSVSP